MIVRAAMDKTCTICKNTYKATLEFFKRNGKNSLSTYCRSCINAKQQEKRKKSNYNENRNKYLSLNKDKLKIWDRRAKEKRKDKITINNREYMRNRYHCDINFKLSRCLRSRLNKAIKGNYKSGSAISDLGCSIEELKKYLESKFQEGMSWNNYGKWHIDHIKPLASFDLKNRDELLKACHYTNLQPLWAKDNLSKNNKII